MKWSIVKLIALAVIDHEWRTWTPSQRSTRSPQRRPARSALLFASIDWITARKNRCGLWRWLGPEVARVSPNPLRNPWLERPGSRRSRATCMLLAPTPPEATVTAGTGVESVALFGRCSPSTSSMIMRITSPSDGERNVVGVVEAAHVRYDTDAEDAVATAASAVAGSSSVTTSLIEPAPPSLHETGDGDESNVPTDCSSAS